MLGGSLLVLISAQLCFGVYFIARTAMSPGKFLDCWFVDTYGLNRPSAIDTGDRFRCVRDLLLPTLEVWGALFHQSSYCFRYALTGHPSTLDTISPWEFWCALPWHRRFRCVFDDFGRNQETRDE